MDNQHFKREMEIIITIVNRGKGEKVVEILRKKNILSHFICLGKGTADSEILDYLGIGETQKDIVITATDKDVNMILKTLYDEMHFNKPGYGISFSVRLNSISSSLAMKILTDNIK